MKNFLKSLFVVSASLFSDSAQAISIEGLDLTMRPTSFCMENTAVAPSILNRQRSCARDPWISEAQNFTVAEATTWLRLSSGKRGGNRFVGIGYSTEIAKGTRIDFRLRGKNRATIFWRMEY